jgi:hypothetical protein
MADLYTIWADKEGDISDIDWVNGMKSFFDHLCKMRAEWKLIESHVAKWDSVASQTCQNG